MIPEIRQEMEMEQTTSGGLTNRNEDMSETAKRGLELEKLEAMD